MTRFICNWGCLSIFSQKVNLFSTYVTEIATIFSSGKRRHIHFKFSNGVLYAHQYPKDIIIAHSVHSVNTIKSICSKIAFYGKTGINIYLRYVAVETVKRKYLHTYTHKLNPLYAFTNWSSTRVLRFFLSSYFSIALLTKRSRR